MCKDCLAKWVKSSTTNANNNRCPFCRAELFERDDDDALSEDELDDDVLRGSQLLEALMGGAYDLRAPSPAEGQRQRSAEYQRLVEQFEQFNREIRAPDQPLRESHAQEQPLRETAAAREARDDAERLRWYRPRHQPELARLHQERARARLEHANARLERARARVALARDRRRPHVPEVPRLVRSDADHEGLAAMTGAHIKAAENLMRSDEVYNIGPRFNQADGATRNPAASTRVHVEGVRNNQDYETEPRRFVQGTVAPMSFAARMCARAEVETPMEWDNRRMATLGERAAEERVRVDEVVNRYIRHEEHAAPLQNTAEERVQIDEVVNRYIRYEEHDAPLRRRQGATSGIGLGGAHDRRRRWLGEEVHQIPTAHEPGIPSQRQNRRMTTMREETAEEGALAFGRLNLVSGGRGPGASPRWVSGEVAAGIGGADVIGRQSRP